jgi:MFS family permease
VATVPPWLWLLPLAIALLPFAAMGDLWGPRKVFLGGLAFFTVSSLACALATVEHAGCRINLIDTPGMSDFRGPMLTALAAVETVAVVVDPAPRAMPMTAADASVADAPASAGGPAPLVVVGGLWVASFGAACVAILVTACRHLRFAERQRSWPTVRAACFPIATLARTALDAGRFRGPVVARSLATWQRRC